MIWSWSYWCPINFILFIDDLFNETFKINDFDYIIRLLVGPNRRDTTVMYSAQIVVPGLLCVWYTINNTQLLRAVPNRCWHKYYHFFHWATYEPEPEPEFDIYNNGTRAELEFIFSVIKFIKLYIIIVIFVE